MVYALESHAPAPEALQAFIRRMETEFGGELAESAAAAAQKPLLAAYDKGQLIGIGGLRQAAEDRTFAVAVLPQYANRTIAAHMEKLLSASSRRKPAALAR